VLIGLNATIPLRWLLTRACFWLIILSFQGLSGHEASSDHCGWLQRRVSARQKRQVTLAPCNVTLLDILERSTHLNNHSVYFSWLETIYETTFEENLCRTNITKFSANCRWNFRVLQPEEKIIFDNSEMFLISINLLSIDTLPKVFFLCTSISWRVTATPTRRSPSSTSTPNTWGTKIRKL